ncbi:hypothetical protein MTO96_052187 [Rhipicephalus appendiculatus]
MFADLVQGQHYPCSPDVWEDVLSLGDITKTVRKKSPFKGAKPSTPTDEEIEYLLDNPEDDSIAQQLYPPSERGRYGYTQLENGRYACSLTASRPGDELGLQKS